MVCLLRNYIVQYRHRFIIILRAHYSVQRLLMSRKHGQLPLAETDREDNDSISDKPSTVPDPEPALEALRDVHANLVERLHSPSVIEHLYSGRLLTKVEYDVAKSKESNYDKNTEVLGALMRRGRAEVLKFCQLLFEQNQHNCGRLLLDGISALFISVICVSVYHLKDFSVYSLSENLMACHGRCRPLVLRSPAWVLLLHFIIAQLFVQVKRVIYPVPGFITSATQALGFYLIYGVSGWFPLPICSSLKPSFVHYCVGEEFLLELYEIDILTVHTVHKY